MWHYLKGHGIKLEKIISKEEYLSIREELKKEGKITVLCHGVFDLVHPGHIQHFQEAKTLGDVLVVSVTSADFVRKGPGRPYFGDELRTRFLAAIECIDYVILSRAYTAEDIIEAVKPNIYVKGQDYANSSKDITGMIDRETSLVRKYGGKVHFTGGQSFSSTKLLNRAFPVISDEVRSFMGDFSRKYSFAYLKEQIECFRGLKVLVVGEVIIDEYIYCTIKGLMSKDRGYSAAYSHTERYLGGALAVAGHLAAFVDNVTIASVTGEERDIGDMISSGMNSHIKTELIQSRSYQTIIKRRYITKNQKREELHKIFAVNNISDQNLLDKEALGKLKRKLEDTAAGYDMVILCDYGHGLVDEEIRNILQSNAKMLTVNCQTNSANYGMNLITKYHGAQAYTLDQRELHLAMGTDRGEDVALLRCLRERLGGIVWLTQGACGAAVVDGEEIYRCPALTLSVIDTIGAGDAFLAIVGLCTASGVPADAAVFLGNVGGGLSANIVGNQRSIDKVDFLKFTNTLLNI